MQVDLFATRFNHRLPLFVSPFPDPQALAVDGLSLDWEGRDLYAFPPTSLIPTILKRLTLFSCSMTLIAPLDWRRSWTTDLLRRSTQPPLALPMRPDLLIQPGQPFLHQRLEALNLHAWRLCGGDWRPEDTTLESLVECCTAGRNLL